MDSGEFMIHIRSRKIIRLSSLLFFFLLASILVLTGPIRTLSAARAQEPLDTLSKIDQILNTVKGYVDVLTNEEIGEQELMQYLPTFAETNPDIQKRCQAMTKDAGHGSAIVDYQVLYAGLLGDTPDVDLVKIIKDKLAVDGFDQLNEKRSRGLTTVIFDRPQAGPNMQKHYILWINKSWRIRVSDFFKGETTNNSFCLVKVEKL
jgi:hypothetical protein